MGQCHLIRAVYDVKIEYALRRSLLLQEKLLTDIKSRCEQLTLKISNLMDEADSEDDTVFLGIRIHSATAVPVFHDTSIQCLGDVASTAGPIPVNSTGQAVLYDICDIVATTDDDKERAPQWFTAPTLCASCQKIGCLW